MLLTTAISVQYTRHTLLTLIASVDPFEAISYRVFLVTDTSAVSLADGTLADGTLADGSSNPLDADCLSSAEDEGENTDQVAK